MKSAKARPGALPPLRPENPAGFLARTARAGTRLNALLIVCLAQTVLCLFLIVALISIDTTERIRVAFVKLHPNGSYHVSFNDSEQPFSLFASTIDALLRKAIVSRYRENPDTIVADYNAAALFMGATELQKFIDEFDAPAYIEDYLSCPGCPVVEPVVQTLHHLEDVSPRIDTLSAGKVIRSTMYLNFEYRDRRTGALLREEAKIVPLSWHLDPAKIAAIGAAGDATSMQALNVNPIGLTLLSYSLADDRSQDS